MAGDFQTLAEQSRALAAGELSSRELTTATLERISVGDLAAEIKTESRDEIGELAEAIARMQDSIRLSIERLRRRR